jgi:hypothetical protein
MRTCPNCKRESVVADGYCAHCRQCVIAPEGVEPIGFKWDGLPWVPAKARKKFRCVAHNSLIYPGDSVWRPLTNSNRRMERILRIPFDATDFLYSPKL